MRFRCERCRAKYRIDDALLAGQVRRIRCQRCSAVMTLRGARAVGAPDGTVMSGPPPQISDIAWFARIDGATRGPFTEDEVVRQFHDGDISAHTSLWHDALADWERLIDLHDFAVLFTPRRRLKAKAERMSAVDGTVVDFMKATEAVEAEHSAVELYLPDDNDEAVEDETDPTDPYDILNRSDVEWVPFSDEGDAEDDDTLERSINDEMVTPDLGVPATAREDTIPLAAARGVSDSGSDTDEGVSAPPLEVADAPAFLDEPPREGTDQYLAAGGLTRRPMVLAAGVAGVGFVVAAVLSLVAALGGDDSAEANVVVRPVSSARPTLQASWDDVGAGATAGCLVEGGCPEEAPVPDVAVRTRAQRAAGPRSNPAEAERVRQLLAGGRGAPSIVPTVQLEHTLVPDQSALSAEDVEAIVKRGVSAVQFCVEQNARVQQPITGRQVLNFVVDPSGLVDRARFENGVVNASPLGECVVRAAKRWRFPAFAGDGVELRVPLVLGS